MGLFDKLRGELIDIIEWIDQSNNTIAYRFDRMGNEIKNNAKLTVRESQAAVFINQGVVADVFVPGMYTLTTENLPVLSTLKGWKYGFNSPFKAEVYFVNTKKFTGQKWGTKTPIILSDQRFGMLEIRAFGTYVFKISDPARFIKEVAGTDGHFTTEEINSQLKSLVVSRFTDAIGEAKVPVEAFASQVNELSTLIKDLMQDDFFDYGIELTSFLIESVSMPDEIKKEIFELSRLNTIDLARLTQMKTAKAIEKAAENPSGTAGAGMGMGMGFAMANQMGNTLGGMLQQPTQQAPKAQSGGVPPQIPQPVNYFVAVNGQQSGPHDINTLQQMVAQGQINRDTLVWKSEMPNWQAANQQADLSSIFSNVPPPIPGQ